MKQFMRWARIRSIGVKALGVLTLAALLSACAPATRLGQLFSVPQITRNADGTFNFSGILGLNSADTVIAALPPDATVILDLLGGLTTEAMRIGDHIAQNRIRLVVRGRCYSSCANYLLGASPEVTLERESRVGFHGGAINSRQQLLSDCGGVSQCSDAQIQQRSPELFHELRYLKRYALNLDFLELSGQITAGGGLWIPNLAELRCYGLHLKGLEKDPPPPQAGMVRTRDLSPEFQHKVSEVCATTSAHEFSVAGLSPG